MSYTKSDKFDGRSIRAVLPKTLARRGWYISQDVFCGELIILPEDVLDTDWDPHFPDKTYLMVRAVQKIKARARRRQRKSSTDQIAFAKSFLLTELSTPLSLAELEHRAKCVGISSDFYSLALTDLQVRKEILELTPGCWKTK